MKSCKNCNNQFEITPDDQAFYQKIAVPEPTLCFACRAIRRMVWWNEHNLYRKKDIHGNEIFSTFPELTPVKIMERDEWWGDSWDGLEYGRDYDFTSPFFEQFGELMREVPWPSRDIQRSVNSDYSNMASDLKNCYLVFNSGQCENCLYGVGSLDMRDSLDYYFSGACELCYEVVNAHGCYQTFFSTDVIDCRNVWYVRDCRDCSDCFGCVNLRSKKYHIFNTPYAKEEYFEKIKTLKADDAYAFWKTQPYRYAQAIQNVNSTGDYIYNCKNARQCYQVVEGENAVYSQIMGHGVKDVMDYTNWGMNAELIYESITVGENVRNLKFCFNCWPGSTDLEYCVNVMSSSNCFGCVSLRKKQYCVFNRQYDKENYEILVKKIKTHMGADYGEFFPVKFSPLAYNESVAIDYFTLSEAEAKSKGYLWRELEERKFEITPETPACATCKRAFRIIDREKEFYQRFNLPIPSSCHRCRFTARRSKLNPLRWWTRRCANCSAEVQTTFAPERPETIYCESCYQTLF